MAPAPTPEHQDIVLEIAAHLRTHIKLAGPGRVFLSSVDVELWPKNVFQPDVVVVLNAHLNRIAAKKIIGAPDLVVEVVSPGGEVMDRIARHAVYARAGIPENWLVKPEAKSVEVFALEQGEYRSLGVYLTGNFPLSIPCTLFFSFMTFPAYSHFLASLHLIFPVQGSPEMAARCLQQLQEVFKRHDIPLQTVNCNVEGWAEDTTFHPLTEHDITKLHWNDTSGRFMHPEEE